MRLEQPRGDDGGLFPTHAAIKLGHEWGTRVFVALREKMRGFLQSARSTRLLRASVEMTLFGLARDSESNDWWLGGGIHSHPCRDEAAAWMGHPVICGSSRKMRGLLHSALRAAVEMTLFGVVRERG